MAVPSFSLGTDGGESEKEVGIWTNCKEMINAVPLPEEVFSLTGTETNTQELVALGSSSWSVQKQRFEFTGDERLKKSQAYPPLFGEAQV